MIDVPYLHVNNSMTLGVRDIESQRQKIQLKLNTISYKAFH